MKNRYPAKIIIIVFFKQNKLKKYISIKFKLKNIRITSKTMQLQLQTRV